MCLVHSSPQILKSMSHVCFHSISFPLYCKWLCLLFALTLNTHGKGQKDWQEDNTMDCTNNNSKGDHFHERLKDVQGYKSQAKNTKA